ncbi:MAG: nucleotide sugar dehydrogenase [Nitrospiraceae bacterium]
MGTKKQGSRAQDRPSKSGQGTTPMKSSMRTPGGKPIAKHVAVVGLGYVGLPIAIAFAKHLPVLGFDVNTAKIDELRHGIDRTNEVSTEDLKKSSIVYSSNPQDLKVADFIIVAVPTPINDALQPDVTALCKASESIGAHMSKGAVVVYESTVYPGLTEEICQPILERSSGMKCGRDFKLGYSPERINPGDKAHTLATITKVVSAQDAETLEVVANTYSLVVEVGVHRASSIRVAEAAKVIENTQRDLNIALMNELALIFDRLGIDTKDVLTAAGTKWNFLKFSPGLVGGHCIGVDPYYLTSKAESVGYHPQVILAGRRINNGMGKFIAEKTIKMLAQRDRPIKDLRVGVLGLTFKENVPDLRNSKVPDIIRELEDYGAKVFVHDPMAEAEEAHVEYRIHLHEWKDMVDMDAIVLAVSHKAYLDMGLAKLLRPLRQKNKGVLVDVKACLTPSEIPQGISYWRL